MGVQLYREYKLKFYLNGSHYIIMNGRKGEVHPHTWEFALNFRVARNTFREFNEFEKEINQYLSKYQNKVLNDIEPFQSILPTIENITEYLSEEFYRIIHDLDGILDYIEASETPTRTYIYRLSENNENAKLSSDLEEDILSMVMDEVLDDIIEEG